MINLMVESSRLEETIKMDHESEDNLNELEQFFFFCKSIFCRHVRSDRVLSDTLPRLRLRRSFFELEIMLWHAETESQLSTDLV